ncbi:MAG: DUF2917 domain-containing protein [Rubrivivax sp.]|nr:DUF2917 domain-containing protein [Rubrivivax sp.]
MAHTQDLSLTPLARRALLALPQGAGRAVAVFSGRVWVTEAGDMEDKVLGPGDSVVLKGTGLAVVEALHDSRIMLFEPAGRTAAAGAAPALPEQPRSVSEYEREALALRQQAVADAMQALWGLLRRGFARLAAAARA